MQKQFTIKILVIVALTLALLIPVSMVSYKVYERQAYKQDAHNFVSKSWAGTQTVFTPILLIKYRSLAQSKSGFEIQKIFEKTILALPDSVIGNIYVDNKTIHKGIYDVPVYNSELSFSAHLSEEKLKRIIDSIRGRSEFDEILSAHIAIHVSDVGGIDKQPSLLLNGKAIALKPSSTISGLISGLHAPLSFEQLEKDLNLEFKLGLRGMANLSFLQLAENASVTMESNWPHPQFSGTALPRDRNINKKGFTASWQQTLYASDAVGIFNSCLDSSDCGALLAKSSGVDFEEAVDVYLQTERSLKYAILFIGLSFMSFFIFEHVRGQRIHPIQYAFTGVALAIFYLLLISFAEHLAFSWAYALSAVACISLIIFYTRSVLQDRNAVALFALMLSSLYGLLYVIVQAEDFALLMGSLLVFVVISVLMLVTRKINWYDLNN